MLKSFNNLHHAYLVVGEREAAEASLLSFFESQGATLAGSPDFFPFKNELFGIAEARELSLKASSKGFTLRKVFLISPQRITREAQNALLKTFEDPYPATHFFLIVREEALIIPTLRSRMQTVHVKGLASATDAQKFLSLAPAERLAFAKKFSDEEKDLSRFLDELLRITRSRKVYAVRKWSDDRSAAARLILEHLSLVL